MRKSPAPIRLKGRVTIRATSPGDPANLPGKSVSIVAYTGEPLAVTGYDLPVIVDLATAVYPPTVPLLYDHSPAVEDVVGRADRISNDGATLTASGRVWGHNERSRSVIEASAVGHSWQASIGANPASLTRVEMGSVVSVNGRDYSGPALVAHGTVIREISFVVLGADQNTSAILARAKLRGSTVKPTFDEWLASLGFTVDALDPTQLANLQLLYAETYPGEDVPSDTPPEVTPPEVTPPTDAPPAPASAGARPLDVVANLRRTVSAETDRIANVQRVTVGFPAICAQAIREGWSSERAELATLRASRPTPPSVNAGRGANGTDPFRVMQAAILQASRAPGLEASFTPQILDAAHTQFRSRIGLQEVIHAAARQNGYVGGVSVKNDLPGMLRAAFSTFSLPGILSNVANKFLLAGFMGVDQAFSQISSKRTVTDFKTSTSYRMTGAFQFEEVGADGELKHGGVSEESYTNAAKSYGKMFAVTRQDLINDDLGALTALPQRIGRGAALKLNEIFWTAFLDNSSFFASGNSNYYAHAASVLSSAALVVVEQKFLDQVDADGKPLGISPAILLTPTSLSRTAKELMSSSNFVAGGDSTGSQIPSTNTWQGAYTPVTTPYLNNSAFSGYSALAWYLLASPADCPVIEVAYLNGVETPTVETADADFNTLGIQMRGFFDFGVAKQDYRGGVKSKGAA